MQDSDTVSKNLIRLERLQGADEGLFVLAVHSFVEGWVRDAYRIDSKYDYDFDYESGVVCFGDVIQRFLDDLKSRADNGYINGYATIVELIKQHKLTNGVRHSFAPLGTADVEKATAALVVFCGLAGLGKPEELDKISAALAAWNERRPLFELAAENRRLQTLRGKDNDERRKMAAELSDYAEKLRAVKTSAAELKKAQDELAAAESRSGKKDAKLDELRQKKFELEKKLREAEREKDANSRLAETVRLFRTMTALTRTRADYERAIMRLMPDQEAALEQIKYNRDFLLKGAAGTGKTLVLLKAIERAETGEEGEKASIALLTYTTTLAKYDKYIASLLKRAPSGSSITTVNSFLENCLKQINDSYSINYDILKELVQKFPVPDVKPADVDMEIEQFILANDIDKDEYLSGGLKRRGMKAALPKAQRAEIWGAAQKIIASMNETGTFSRNAAAQLIVRSGSGIERPASAEAELLHPDLIFIDEAQDLPAVVIKALKSRAGKAVILAGDADQSIYQPGFTFKSAGIEIAGRTRILRNNFRNSAQIHEVAERFRLMGEAEVESQPSAARDGPEPELFAFDSPNEGIALILSRIRLFIDALDYAPQNICVATMIKRDVDKIKEALAGAGYSVSDIREAGFEFAQEGSIRVSTVNSAKGLDFPVVILYLPMLHGYTDNYDEKEAERLKRSLVYVGMTRAMEQLTVLVPANTTEPVLLDVKKAFEGKAT